MAYKRSITSSHRSDDTGSRDNSEGDSIFGGDAWTMDEDGWMWGSGRRAQRLPRSPTPTFIVSSHVSERDDGSGLEEVEHSPEDCEHLRAMTVAVERHRAQMKARLEDSQHLEQSTQTINDMLGERVADLNVNFCVVGLDLARARRLTKKLKIALLAVSVAFLALLFKQWFLWM